MAIIEDRATAPLVRFPSRCATRCHVPRERYYDREFFELEKEYLWPRGVADGVPAGGDPGAGRLRRVRDLRPVDRGGAPARPVGEGVLQRVPAPRDAAVQGHRPRGRRPDRRARSTDGDGTSTAPTRSCTAPTGFDPECLRPDDIRLRECKVDTWGACVWINMDPDARPLREALSPAAELLDAVGVEDMRVWWWKEMIVDANWKVAQEAFHEGYHVMATHPQLTMGAGGVSGGQRRVHRVRERPRSLPGEPAMDAASIGPRPTTFIQGRGTLWEGQDAMTLEHDLRVFESMRDTVPPGEDFADGRDRGAVRVRRRVRASRCRRPGSIKLWGGEIFLFPNFFMLPMYGNSLSYRVAPVQRRPRVVPVRGLVAHDVPRGSRPGARALAGSLRDRRHRELGSDPAPGHQQHGAHPARACTRVASESRVSPPRWSAPISNMHEELDRYLAQ